MNSTAAPPTNLIGHQGRCFDVRLDVCDENHLLSASEDGSAKLWALSTRTCLQTMVHDKSAEVLRAAFLDATRIATAGSNGQICLWRTTDSRPIPMHNLSHRNGNSQVYVCEPCGISNASQLLSAADNELLLWDINTQQRLQYWRYIDDDNSQTKSFGGEGRNPSGEVFVFDAKWRPSSEGREAIVALSDGTVRVVDTRIGAENSAQVFALDSDDLQARGITLGHATAVNWHESGDVCSVTYGSGIVALIDIKSGELLTMLRPHRAPCYDSLFVSSYCYAQPSVLPCISWSSDSTLSLWRYRPTATPGSTDIDMVTTVEVENMNLLSCCVQPSSGRIVCAGSLNSKAHGFLGTPIRILSPLQPSQS